MIKKNIMQILASMAIFILYSCSTIPLESISERGGQPESVQDQLVKAAYWAEGKKSLKVRGKSFAMDCTGTIMAVYYYAGIDLAKDFNEYEGNGVKWLYYYLNDNNLIYNTKLPSSGDIVFWNNTWDANESGSADDKLTHVGMIVSIDQNTGQAAYVHYNYSKGITIEKLNLLDPDNPAVNAPIRMRSLPKVDGYKYMSSQLIQDLARAYELELDIVDEL